MGTPYYLQPVVTTLEKDSSIDVYAATEFKYDYDYGYLPEPQGAKSMWEEIADSTTQTATKAGDMVWDTAKGTWETAKAGLVASINEVKDIGSSLTDSATGIFDSLLVRILVIFAVLVAAIWLLAKQGVIKDITSVFR